MEVLVFGSASVDFFCYVPRLPRAGETLHGHKFSTGWGGKGANQCVAATRLGALTAFIAKLGDDFWGTNYLAQLKKEGVNVDFIEQCKGEATGIAQISVAANGENQIVIVAGSNNLLSDSDITKAQNLFDSAKILICQLEVPVSATIAALRFFKGISILNAAPALSETPNELLSAATIFCVNESEAALMIGVKEISTIKESKEALIKLIEMGANTIIITLGSLGAVYVKRSEPTKFIHVSAPKIDKVVDTTGAGDAFIGALAYYIARFPKLELHQQIGGACEVASFSVQIQGTQTSFPTSKQIDLDLNLKSFEWTTI